MSGRWRLRWRVSGAADVIRLPAGTVKLRKGCTIPRALKWADKPSRYQKVRICPVQVRGIALHYGLPCRQCCFCPSLRGEVPEWSNGVVSKTIIHASVSRVRIPASPPSYLYYCIALSCAFFCPVLPAISGPNGLFPAVFRTFAPFIPINRKGLHWKTGSKQPSDRETIFETIFQLRESLAVQAAVAGRMVSPCFGMAPGDRGSRQPRAAWLPFRVKHHLMLNGKNDGNQEYLQFRHHVRKRHAGEFGQPGTVDERLP